MLRKMRSTLLFLVPNYVQEDGNLKRGIRVREMIFLSCSGVQNIFGKLYGRLGA